MSVPGKKLETGKAETGVIQQSREQTNMLPSQHVSGIGDGGLVWLLWLLWLLG